jgi:ribosomal-protein-alanine N-acetyltransferase
MPIRRMAPADLGAVAAIEQAYSSAWTRDQVGEELARSDSVTLVNENDRGEIAGWCCARVLGFEAELLKIAVQPEAKRAGCGDALLRYLERLLTGHGVTDLFLEVRSQNTAALSMYSKHGFALIGKRTGYYTHPDDDAYVLRKGITVS